MTRKDKPGPLSPEQKKLIEDHLPFVRSIARKLRDQMPAIEFDDLCGFGMQGLVEAARRYDSKHGAVFSTFAYYRVRGAMFDGLRSMGWLPRGEYARMRFDERATAYLENLQAREVATPRPPHLSSAERVDSTEEEVRALATALQGVATVFMTLLCRPGEDALLDQRPQAHEQLEAHQLTQRVKRALSRLPDKERNLIERYYFEDQTLEQVGVSLGLSKSWTSRLHARAINLLREVLYEEADPG